MTDASPDTSEIPVIWNANAGQKIRGPRSPTGEEQVREALTAAGVQARIYATQSVDHAREVISDLAAEGHRRLIAAGGDGTIGQVGRQLIGTDIALGVMPLGSVMNIPRMIGVPRDLAGAASVIATGRVAAIDVGEANGELFFETASVGLNAAIFREAQRFEDGDWGSPFRAVAAAFRYSPAKMALSLDDGKVVTTSGLMVTVSNGAYTGVAMTVAPDARLNDGRFDVRVFRHFSKFELLRHMASIMFGRRQYIPHVSTYRSARVRVVSRRPLPCRADSNDLGMTPLECSVRPASLKVLVGPDYVDGRAVEPDAVATSDKAS